MLKFEGDRAEREGERERGGGGGGIERDRDTDMTEMKCETDYSLLNNENM